VVGSSISISISSSSTMTTEGSITTTSTFQCQLCKRRYKQVSNYNRHTAICALVNSKSIRESTANAMLFSDNEDLASQAPSMGQLYAAVQQLATTVVHLQTKVTRLEQLAYIRKPKFDVRLALMSKHVPPKALFSGWITNRIVVRITRSILIDHIFKTSNLIDAMCKLIMKEVTNASDLSPIYADESKSGLFLTYDDGATPNNNNGEGAGSGSGSGGEWRPMNTDAFRWMVNVIHRQILSEYHSWTVDCNDNSDEFIETSMRYGSILLGGTMDWATLVTRFGTKLWSVMCDKQREREHEGTSS
jgi:hypothetical protein